MRSRNHRPTPGTFRSPTEPLRSIKNFSIESMEELHDKYDVQDLDDLKELVESGFDLKQVHGVGPAVQENIVERLVCIKGLDKEYLGEVEK